MSVFSRWFSNKESDSSTSVEPPKPQHSAADYCEQGQTSLDAGKYVVAMEFFQAAIETDKRFEKAYFLLATAYEKQGKLDKSKATLYGLLAIDPNNMEALKRLQIELPDDFARSSQDAFSKESEAYSQPPKSIPQGQTSIYHYERGNNNATVTIINTVQNPKEYDVSVDFELNRLYFKIIGNEAHVVYPKKCRLNLVFSGWEGYREPRGKLQIPSKVHYNGKNYQVSKIEEYAFCHCGEIVSVDIPNSIHTIGSHAFAYCNKLKSVSVPSSVITIEAYAFTNCSIKSICIPQSVNFIGPKAFSSNPLTSFVFPTGMQEIDASIIDGGCNKYVTIPFTVRTMKGHWGNGLFIKMKGHLPVIQGSIEQHTEVEIPPEYYDEYNNAMYWQCCHLMKRGEGKLQREGFLKVLKISGIIIGVVAVSVLLAFAFKYIFWGLIVLGIVFGELFGKKR